MNRFDRLGETLIVIGVGDQIGLRLHLRAGIAHCDAETAFAKHQHVVRHVADRGDLVGRDREKLRQRRDDGAFVGVRVGDVEIVGLRAGRRRFCAERGLGILFAARDQLEIVAYADDLHRAAEHVLRNSSTTVGANLTVHCSRATWGALASRTSQSLPL